ncbi:MAG: hypothetical protein C0432_03330 [Candidatus Puniceispirillum sp.]|nr:hypothetical protein [Candidatus Pelagibacter sp.]MBA4283306.1 hypothetical protein [Candidatus Puniceispirillum sp.]
MYIKKKARTSMSIFKLAFSIITILGTCFASEAPEKVVQNLYDALHAAQDNDQTHTSPEEVFSPILDQYLDWNQIVNSVLVGPRIAMNKASTENKNKFKSILNSFLEDFVAIFKNTIIKKYSNADYLSKFKKVKKFTINSRQMKVIGKKAEIPSFAEIEDNGQTMQWNLTWQLNLTNGEWKVEDLAIEGGIQLFKTEKDLAQEKYRGVTQDQSESEATFKKGLKAIGEMYNFDY